jgi:endonuclease I
MLRTCPCYFRRAGRLFYVAFSAFLLFRGRVALPAYEVPDIAYAPPTHYYDAALDPLHSVRTNLHNIIDGTPSFPIMSRTYGDSRYSMATDYLNKPGGSPKPSTDQDPSNSSNILLVYNRASIVGQWDVGDTWNREHIWPKYWLNVTSSQVDNNYSGPASDLFELRPANPGINSSRSDYSYGITTSSGGYSIGTSNVVGRDGTFLKYFFPGDADKGDVARAIFYMATRYYDGTATPSINNLTIVNGLLDYTKDSLGNSSPRYQFSDLQSLLKYNYTDGVDNFERRRNQYIYGSSADLTDHALNPSYWQGNRNPFVDHPEYVWAVYGDSPNNSQITVGTPDANGGSTTTKDLGRILLNGAFGTGSVTLNKTGSTPTTYNLTASGAASFNLGASTNITSATGIPFDYNSQSLSLTARLNTSTATTGLKTGVIAVQNTDLTSAGTGHGSADANDAINVSGAVLDKRVVTPSVASVDFGTVVVGAAVGSSFSLSTSGDDNNRTRVNVAGSSTIDVNSMQITGTSTLFNSVASTGSRNIGGTMSSVGNKSGALSLAVTTAENGGAGLTGEGSYSSIGVGYTATVLDHANASFTKPADNNSLSINFGSFVQGIAVQPIAFSVNNLVTTDNLTAGLDLLTIGGTGTTSVLTTNLAAFSNLAAGSASAFQASFDTTNTGNFSATYTLNLSDNVALLGATAQQLTLNLSGVVVPEFMPGDFDRDHQLTAGDIQVMMDALTDLQAYQTLKGLTDPQLNTVANVNVDGSIDNLDAQALLVQLASASGGGGGLAPVPEPSAVVLFMLGAAAVLARRRRG